MLSTLSSGWKFTQVGGGPANSDGEWLDAAKTPTSVHVELLRLKKIPDPFVGLNEWDVQWIGEGDWAFKTTFNVTEDELKEENADLVVEGLDTYGVIQVNGKEVLKTNNMFVGYRVPVKSLLKAGSNDIFITFPSTFIEGRKLEAKHGKLGLWNGDSSRLHTRKAQYNYGWDWGPILLTVGPWKPIHLHTYSTRISDLRVSSDVSSSLSAKITTTVTLTPTSSPVTALVSLVSASGAVVKTAKVPIAASSKETKTQDIVWDIAKDELELWWPVGYGKQVLHSVEVKIVKDEGGKVLDEKVQKIGLRRVRIVQEPLVDDEGRTFLFEVNNVRMFCGGSNWIPADSFLTEIDADRYRAWLQLMVDGNQNMVRIWAGGIFEPDVFYDLCDELGLMVWQDFLFGCGQYPAYDEFIERIIPEAEQAVTRLRHHPSVVIFAGNNEDYQVAESLKLELDYSDEKSDFRKTNFPARFIYERTLPEIVERLSDVYYHRASPYSGFGKETTDKKYGDLHQWNVWHGSQEPWHNWDILAGRFVSEFGMEGYPDRRTVDYWTGGEKAERYPQSRVTNSHNKADGFERRLELYLVENFKHAFGMDDYIYYTQVMQAETLASAYRLWRRNWKGPGREYTAGALVWQINDCWPVTSWAIVDYFLRPKPAYFTIKRELRPYTVGMTRKDVKKFTKEHSAAFFEIDTAVEIWGTNSQLEDKKAKLVVEAFDLDDKSFTWKEEKDVVLGENRSTELWSGSVPGQVIRTKLSDVPRTIVISARLVDVDGTVLARYANWPEPFKFIKFPSPETVNLQITVDESSEPAKVTLKSALPIKGIVLDAEGPEDVKWTDQAIDLVPGDEQVVFATGLKGRKVVARYLGDGTA